MVHVTSPLRQNAGFSIKNGISKVKKKGGQWPPQSVKKLFF
jgi:hypothetical protein